MKVGTIVKLKKDCLGNPIGTLGICYDEYIIEEEHGYAFIFANGNYDGFNINEQLLLLEVVGFDEEASYYSFKNVITLTDDFNRGYWNHIFEQKTNEVKDDGNLLHCPFCGSNDILCEGHYYTCNNCDCTGPHIYPVPDPMAAKTLWNQRSSEIPSKKKPANADQIAKTLANEYRNAYIQDLANRITKLETAVAELCNRKVQ